MAHSADMQAGTGAAAIAPYSSREGPQQTSVRPPARWVGRVEKIILAFFLLFALALPHSVKGTHRALEVAFVLWLATVLLGRRRILPQPLVLPMFLYLLFSGISTALSVDPLLSWDRMKIVCLVLICVLFAQNLRSLGQIRAVMAVLIVSTVLTAALTAWQMTMGVGVEVRALPPDSALAKAGMAPGDIIAAVNGRSVRTPERFRELMDSTAPDTVLRLAILRANISMPFEKLSVQTDRDSIVEAGLLSPGTLARGKPPRAQGTFAHYIVYAEVLLQLALLTWGLAVAGYRERPRLSLALLFAFLAIAATLAATKTRSALGALLIVAFGIVWMAAGRKVRVAAAVAFAALALLSTVWVQRTRGFSWVDMGDPGTQYRVMVWRDGLRLVRQHPWFGVGMETVRTHWREWHMEAYAAFHVQGHFHSTWIQLAAERGLLTLGAWVWFVIAYLIFLVRLARRARTHDWFAYGVALGILGAMLGFLLESVVQYNLGEEQAVVTLWFLAGTAIALERMLPGRTETT